MQLLKETLSAQATGLDYVFALKPGDFKDKNIYLRMPKFKEINNPDYPILLIKDRLNDKYIRIDDLIDLTAEDLYSIALNNLINESVQVERIYIEALNKFFWIFKGNYTSAKFLDTNFIMSYFPDLPREKLMFNMPSVNLLVVASLTTNQCKLDVTNLSINKHLEAVLKINSKLLSKKWFKYGLRSNETVILCESGEESEFRPMKKLKYILQSILTIN